MEDTEIGLIYQMLVEYGEKLSEENYNKKLEEILDWVLHLALLKSQCKMDVQENVIALEFDDDMDAVNTIDFLVDYLNFSRDEIYSFYREKDDMDKRNYNETIQKLKKEMETSCEKYMKAVNEDIECGETFKKELERCRKIQEKQDAEYQLRKNKSLFSKTREDLDYIERYPKIKKDNYNAMNNFSKKEEENHRNRDINIQKLEKEYDDKYAAYQNMLQMNRLFGYKKDHDAFYPMPYVLGPHDKEDLFNLDDDVQYYLMFKRQYTSPTDHMHIKNSLIETIKKDSQNKVDVVYGPTNLNTYIDEDYCDKQMKKKL